MPTDNENLLQPVNILIAGRNGGLVDTIIIARVVPDSKAVNLFSIPRDLGVQVNEKTYKINDLYRYFGVDQLMKTISDITGYKINKYVLIEMMAFAETINLLGGIDVTLQYSLIDPTYKVVNNGKSETLYYPAGIHHLSGIEALRLARSRGTTNDFHRSERQRSILKALLNKAENMRFQTASALVLNAKNIYQHVDTNISLNDALSYFYRFKTYKINQSGGLTNSNVLEPVQQTAGKNCNQLLAEPSKPCPIHYTFYRLQPRGGDWGLIKKEAKKVLD